MSKAEKIVRVIILIIVANLLCIGMNIIISYLNIEDRAVDIFLRLVFSMGLGIVLGNSINNTLYIPNETGKEKGNYEKDRNKEI